MASGVKCWDQAGRNVSSGIYLNLRGDEVDRRYSEKAFRIWRQALRSASPRALILLKRSASSKRSVVLLSPSSDLSSTDINSSQAPDLSPLTRLSKPRTSATWM